MGLTITNIESGLKRHLADNPMIFQEKMADFSANLNRARIQVYNDVEDEMPLYRLDVNDPGQPGNRATENVKTGIANFSNRKLKVRDAEITTKFTNQQINALYRTHLNEIRNAAARGDAYEVPFEDVILDAVVKKFLDRVFSLMLFKGSYNASGTTSADIADGYETLVAADILAGNIPANQVFTGAAITSNNALAQFHGVEDLVAAVSPDYQDEELIMYCAPENLKHYRTNYRATFNALPYNTEFKKNFVNDDVNRPIVDLKALAGDDRLILTTPGNFVLGTDAMSRMENIWMEKRARDLYIYLDCKVGVNYAMADEIWTNDQ